MGTVGDGAKTSVIEEMKKARQQSQEKLRQAARMEEEQIRSWNEMSENSRTEELKKGIFIVKGDVLLGQRLPDFFPDSNRIGKWGVNEKGENDLKKIAFQVYKNSSLWKFVADANGRNSDKIKGDTILYLPDFPQNSFKMADGMLFTHYSYVGININMEKGIIQTAGDIETQTENAIYKEFIFEGQNCIGPLIGINSMTYEDYHREIGPKPQLNQWDLLKWIDNVVKTTLDNADEIDLGLGVRDAIEDNKYIYTMKRGKGALKWKVRHDGPEKFRKYLFGRGTRGYNGKLFAKDLIKSGFKGQLVVCVIWAGADAGYELAIGGNIRSSSYIFGKELVKGLTVTAVTSVATYFLLLLPGLGWLGYLVVAGGALIIGFYTSKGLNALDDFGQQKGIIPKNEDVR